MGLSRRNRGPVPPLPVDPGDFTWAALTYMQPLSVHWQRSDNLEVHLRGGHGHGFTVVHQSRPVTEADVDDVVTLLGLERGDVRLTYGRSPTQQEYAVGGTRIEEMLEEFKRAIAELRAER